MERNTGQPKARSIELERVIRSESDISLAPRTSESQNGSSIDPLHLDSTHEQTPHDSTEEIKAPKHIGPGVIISIWMWEIAALVASVAVLAAVFGSLSRYSDQDLPSWPLSMNLNSLVSIYTIILRALLLLPVTEVIGQYRWLWFKDSKPLLHLDKFDRAGRGVWGSICLFALSIKPNLAILGALVSIVSLAIGPFAQQAIRNDLCERRVPGLEGTVPIAQILPRDFFRVHAGDYRLSPETTGVILNGLLGFRRTDNTSAISYACPNGNCTFASVNGVTYSSIGLCSRCQDITSTIKEVNNHTWGPSPAFGLSDDFILAPNDGEGPYLVANTWGSLSPDEATSFETVAGATILSATLANCSGISETLANNLPGPGDMNVSCPHNFAALQGLMKGVNMLATNCSFSICLKNYHGKVVNGKLTEQLLSMVPAGHDVWPESDITDTPWAGNYTAVKEPCIVDGLVYDFSNFSTVSAKNHTFLTLTHENDTIAVPELCVFKVPNLWVGTLSTRLQELLSGFCTWNLRQDADLSCEDKWWFSTLYEDWKATPETISQHFDDIATAVTNRMRELDGTRVRGEVLQTSICIRIEWAWLTMPALVEVFAIVFFLVGIWQTSRAGIPFWKSSNLPLLFYGPPESSDIRLYQPLHLKQLEMRAEKIKMRCETNEDVEYGFHTLTRAEAEPLIDKTDGNALEELALVVPPTQEHVVSTDSVACPNEDEG